MGKKSKVAAYKANRAPETGRVHNLPNAGWDPLNAGVSERRDQSYVKNVRPRSEGQKRLMEAISNNNLVMAIGPAKSLVIRPIRMGNRAVAMIASTRQAMDVNTRHLSPGSRGQR